MRISEQAEALRRAAITGDAEAAGRLVERLRFGVCLRYDDIYALVSDVVEPGEWDALMAEADELGSR